MSPYALIPLPSPHFILWNSQSLYQKFPVFKTMLSSYSLLVVGICEMWLTDAFLCSDFPSSPCTQAFLYANDISLLCSAPTIQETQLHLECGLDSVHSWIIRWSLTINTQKMGFLCFTRWHISNTPVITISGSPILFKTYHKFFSLLLDSHGATW